MLQDWYGKGIRTIAVRFWDAAPDKGYTSKEHVTKNYIAEDQKEELFTYWLSRAMVAGRVGDVLDLLDDEDKIRVNNILKTSGYEREYEERRRGEERGEEKKEQTLGENISNNLHGQSVGSTDSDTDVVSRDAGAYEERTKTAKPRQCGMYINNGRKVVVK